MLFPNCPLFFLQKRKNLIYYKKKEKIVIYQKGYS